MSHKKLVSDLVKDLKPVKVVKFNWLSYFQFILSAIFCLLATFAVTGIRLDISEIIMTQRFIFECIALVILSIASATSAFQLSIPGEEKKYTITLPLSVLVLWLLFLIYLMLQRGSPVAGWGFTCATESIGLSLLPGLILFLLVRRAAPFKLNWVLVFVIIAAGGFGMLGTQMTCSNSDPLHTIIWHGLPIIILAVFGYLLSKKFSYLFHR